MKPLQEENAKELEIFADVLERAVICLKENSRQADLEAGTLYTIVLEKIPEKLLSQQMAKIKLDKVALESSPLYFIHKQENF